MTDAQKKLLIKHAEALLTALPTGLNDRELDIALDAVQALLDHAVGLATPRRLVFRMNQLATRAAMIDLERAGK